MSSVVVRPVTLLSLECPRCSAPAVACSQPTGEAHCSRRADGSAAASPHSTIRHDSARQLAASSQKQSTATAPRRTATPLCTALHYTMIKARFARKKKKNNFTSPLNGAIGMLMVNKRAVPSGECIRDDRSSNFFSFLLFFLPSLVAAAGHGRVWSVRRPAAGSESQSSSTCHCCRLSCSPSWPAMRRGGQGRGRDAAAACFSISNPAARFADAEQQTTGCADMSLSHSHCATPSLLSTRAHLLCQFVWQHWTAVGQQWAAARRGEAMDWRPASRAASPHSPRLCCTVGRIHSALAHRLIPTHTLAALSVFVFRGTADQTHTPHRSIGHRRRHSPPPCRSICSAMASSPNQTRLKSRTANRRRIRMQMEAALQLRLIPSIRVRCPFCLRCRRPSISHRRPLRHSSRPMELARFPHLRHTAAILRSLRRLLRPLQCRLRRVRRSRRR